jgi:glycerol kinase
LVVDSYFSGTKIKWMLENLPNVRKKAENGDILFGTIDTWLIWKLTNGSEHVTDHTNASRTLLYNIKTKSWDDELCEILSVPKALLPQIQNSASDFGVTSIDVLNAEIPINGVAGDQQSALYGQGGFSIGDTKCTYGTGCFLLSNIGDTIKKSEHGLLTTIACDAFGKPVYAIEGAVFIGGAVIQWIRDELQLITSASESETIATSISDNDGVYVVPAFVGLGAPYWKQEARGTITGLTRGTGKSHIVRSALESIAYQVHDLVKAIQKDTKIPISELLVDGGAAANNFLMQYQSDILNSAINRPQNIETTALGAGMLAGIGSGFWTSPEELIEIRQVDAIFNPKMDKDKREHLLKGWRIAIDKTIKN